MSKPLLQVKHLSKHFGQHQVLNNISFDLHKGKILGIVGANGSGKSTLMNCIFGHEKIKNTGGRTGHIYLEGQVLDIDSHVSYKSGIGMVHQEFALFNQLTVAENIKVCHENTLKFNYIDRKSNEEDADKLLKELGLTLDVSTSVRKLSISLQQFTEIARELNRQDLRLLILDEPTAVLNEADSQKLLSSLKTLTKRGIAILFISHRLEEVKSLCDDILILRDGQMVGLHEKDDLSIEAIAEKMIGDHVSKAQHSAHLNHEEIHLSLKNYSVAMDGERLEKLNLDIYKGELLGVTSLSGHGKLALGKGLMNLYPSRGQVHMMDKDISDLSYKNRIKEGLYVLCEDRKNIGLLLNESIKNNIIYTSQQILNKYSRSILKGFIQWTDYKEAARITNHYIKSLEINCQSPNQIVATLSGGNQQKVCLARSMALDPEILLVAEPTRGIDIAAKEKVLKSLIELNKNSGTTIVIASSELDELKRLCTRIAVLCEGKLVAILPATASAREFGLALSGGVKDGL
jgi:simple sugar transport system ATP-binding protein